jgi:hypothetical protein
LLEDSQITIQWKLANLSSSSSFKHNSSRNPIAKRITPAFQCWLQQMYGERIMYSLLHFSRYDVEKRS